MIRSMTGFARLESKHAWGTVIWEFRSVNQRYLETSIRLPESFRHLETNARDKLRLQLTRGKIEGSLRVDVSEENSSTLVINKKLATDLIDAAKWIEMQAPVSALNPIDILRWPGVTTTVNQDLAPYSDDILQDLDYVIAQLITSREEEGQKLKALIEERLLIIDNEVAKVRRFMPEALEWQHNRLLNRFDELRVELDPARLEQEFVILAQKSDVAEELDRLNVHVKETFSVLKTGDAVGRRLDFLMQEFNREANTLSSKSINNDITTSAINIKVLIEQMREQVQNIE